MKKYILALGLAAISCQLSYAQLSQGGIPWSITNNISLNEIYTSQYDLPDWDAFQKTIDHTKFNAPHYIGMKVTTQVAFPNSGTITILPDGSKIWSANIAIDRAPAMGLYFDRFTLPKGVEMFVTNANRKQVLGAYTSSNMNEFNSFAMEPVQGGVARLELNIPASIDLNDIDLNIDGVLVYFTSIANLEKFVDGNNVYKIDYIDDMNFGRSSKCTINSICEQGNDYSNQRNATLQILDPNGAFCSGSMVPHLGNSPSQCDQYFLSASHCEPTGTRNNAIFARMLFRFHYESPTCTQPTTVPNAKTLTGAKLLARGMHTEDAMRMRGDFMLLDLNETVPAAWGGVMNGWNANNDIPLRTTNPKKFMGFHHPAGDIKKLSFSNAIFKGGSVERGSHWTTTIPVGNGKAMRGSSGSGLVDGDGRIIGIASTAASTRPASDSCNRTFDNRPVDALDRVNYASLSYSWEYTIDGGDRGSQLKPWLDPNNTGNRIANPMTTECKAIGGGLSVKENFQSNLQSNVSVYPNPNVGTNINLAFNLSSSAKEIKLELLDIYGRLLRTTILHDVENVTYTMDISELSSGMYIINISTGFESAIHKFSVVK